MRAWGEGDHRRTLRLLGRIKNRRTTELAHRCGWCGRWKSAADYMRAHMLNALVSDGMCDKCAKRWAADPSYRGVGSTPPAA
jgi:hypothetical protein